MSCSQKCFEKCMEMLLEFEFVMRTANDSKDRDELKKMVKLCQDFRYSF